MSFNIVPRRLPLMLSALDAASDGALVDLSALDPAGRNRIHSRRARRAVGVELICKHCQRPVHLHRGPNHHNSDGLWWFQHNPGQAAGCDLAEVSRGGESQEHLAGKLLALKIHRRLGWDIVPEHRSTTGPLVIADLFAKHPSPSPSGHQKPRCIEIQLSSSSAGDIAQRSVERSEAFGVQTQWLTPDTRTLGDQWGLVVDPECQQVVDRLYLDPDRGIPLGALPVAEVISRTARDKHTMVMAAVGPALEHGGPATWIVYPTTQSAARMARKASRSDANQSRPVEVFDRDHCDRNPLPALFNEFDEALAVAKNQPPPKLARIRLSRAPENRYLVSCTHAMMLAGQRCAWCGGNVPVGHTAMNNNQRTA